MIIDAKQLRQIEEANRLPINQAAKHWLAKTDWGINPSHLYIMSLMNWGLENGVQATNGDDLDYLLVKLDQMPPAKLTSLVTGERDEEVNLTADQLLNEETPEEAAMLLLESLISNLAAVPE